MIGEPFVEAWAPTREAAEAWVEARNAAEWTGRAAYFHQRGTERFNPDPCIQYAIVELADDGEVIRHDVEVSRPGSSGTSTDAPNGGE